MIKKTTVNPFIRQLDPAITIAGSYSVPVEDYSDTEPGAYYFVTFDQLKEWINSTGDLAAYEQALGVPISGTIPGGPKIIINNTGSMEIHDQQALFIFSLGDVYGVSFGVNTFGIAQFENAQGYNFDKLPTVNGVPLGFGSQPYSVLNSPTTLSINNSYAVDISDALVPLTLPVATGSGGVIYLSSLTGNTNLTTLSANLGDSIQTAISPIAPNPNFTPTGTFSLAIKDVLPNMWEIIYLTTYSAWTLTGG